MKFIWSNGHSQNIPIGGNTSGLRYQGEMPAELSFTCSELLLLVLLIDRKELTSDYFLHLSTALSPR